MFTKPMSQTEWKQLFLEALLNTTDKVDKINDNGVLGGTAFGVSKVAQKVMKEIALVEAHRIIDSAYGPYLDSYAEEHGIAPRFEASISSTFLRLVGSTGTLYQQGITIFSGSHGVNFELTEDVMIGSHGFIYAKVRSTTTGLNSNIDALSINKISPLPVGHNYSINEVQAVGGRDSESDDLFRKRIKESINLAATDTISKMEQILMKINPDILRVFNQGVSSNGKTILALTTQNGVDLTSDELSDLQDKAAQYLSLSDIAPYGYQNIGVEFRNSNYQYIDIDFQCELETGANGDSVRKDIQVRMNQYLDWTKWDAFKVVQWDVLLTIVRTAKGIKNVSDNTFYPRVDISIPFTKLPRMRSFIMRDLSGNIISDVSGLLVPTFYQNFVDLSYQRTILASL